jgi:hypothetical protein
VITELPEQLISQAEFLRREAAFNEANVRRPSRLLTTLYFTS